MYMLADKPADERQRVMLHRLFHRIQAELGFTASNGFNEHLDTLEGRVWMQLEWRALRRALESSGSDRAEAIADALAFRRERRRMVREALADAVPEQRKKIERARPKLEPAMSFIDAILENDVTAPRKQRHTAHRIYDRLRMEKPEIELAETTVRKYVREKKLRIGLIHR